MNLRPRIRLLVVSLLPLFAACGGGGSADSAAPPSPTPGQNSPPGSAAVVTVFSNPTPQVYASLGSSTTSAGDGYSSVEPNARLTDVSLEAMNQPRLRYAASGRYELQLPGATFEPLVFYAGLVNPDSDDNFFQPASAPQNSATFIIGRSRFDGYSHSELASWSNAIGFDRLGLLAFGTPTPSAGIATAGRATYRGRIFGMVDITAPDNLYGGSYFISVEGTVTLTVDFTGRALAGTVSIDIEGRSSPLSVPLSATTLLPDDTFWGSFETSQSGFNELKVRLTGPDASELIGSWAIPMLIDGEPHQLMGAWIAVRDI